MNISKDKLKLENSTDVSEEKIPDEAKPIIDRVENQIASIVKGFNQVFKDNGVPEATIGEFQYIIQIQIPPTSSPTPKPGTDSAPQGNSADSEDVEAIEIILKRRKCRTTDANGNIIWVPCEN
jgi:hypothetical protein